MILNALHGDQLPVYGDGHAGPQLDPREDFARASATCSSTARPGEVYNAGGPDECAEHRGRQPDHRADRRRRVADRVRHRPPRPRPPLLAQLGQGARRSAGSRACASTTGLEQTVAWYRDNRPGGSRSARATTARTTSASTGARWAPDVRGAGQLGSCEIFAAVATLRSSTVSSRDLSSPSFAHDGAGLRPVDAHAADREIGLVGVLEDALHRRDTRRGVAVLGDRVAQFGDDEVRADLALVAVLGRRWRSSTVVATAFSSPVKSEAESLFFDPPPAQPASASAASRAMAVTERMRRAA